MKRLNPCVRYYSKGEFPEDVSGFHRNTLGLIHPSKTASNHMIIAPPPRAFHFSSFVVLNTYPTVFAIANFQV
jgi:hypothetical protein